MCSHLPKLKSHSVHKNAVVEVYKVVVKTSLHKIYSEDEFVITINVSMISKVHFLTNIEKFVFVKDIVFLIILRVRVKRCDTVIRLQLV